MARKENKGGQLTNEQVEQDLKAKGRTTDKNAPYIGAQDTGEKTVRPQGNEGQKPEGQPHDAEGTEP